MKLRKCFKVILLFIVNHLMCGNFLWKTKCMLLKMAGLKIGKNVRIVAPIYIGTCANLRIGDNCWIGKNCTIYGNANVDIGSNCDLAPDVSFVTGTHEMGNSERRAGKGYCKDITVGTGCWLGARCVLMPGINVGNGAVVGAMSLVMKDVEKNV